MCSKPWGHTDKRVDRPAGCGQRLSQLQSGISIRFQYFRIPSNREVGIIHEGRDPCINTTSLNCGRFQSEGSDTPTVFGRPSSGGIRTESVASTNDGRSHAASGVGLDCRGCSGWADCPRTEPGVVATRLRYRCRSRIPGEGVDPIVDALRPGLAIPPPGHRRTRRPCSP